MTRRLLFLSCIVFILLLSIVSAQQTCDDIYVFYSKTCPHCAKEKVFLADLEEKYPQMSIQYIEVSENYDLFKKYSESHNSIPVGVPRTFINGTVFIGFTEETGPMQYIKGYQAYNGYANQIEKTLIEHLAAEKLINASDICLDEPTEKDEKDYLFSPILILFLYLVFFIIFRKRLQKRYLIGILLALFVIILFYLSQHLPTTEILSFEGQFSFPVFTFIIALLDGFNPCALAVLASFISLTIFLILATNLLIFS